MNKTDSDKRKKEEKMNLLIDKANQSAQFYIKTINFYNDKFPELRKPVEIGSFSSKKRIDKLESNSIKIENQGVKYLVLPETFPDCKFDLNVGQSDFIPHIPHQNGIDSILRWILDNKNKFLSNSEEQNNGFFFNQIILKLNTINSIF
jgi:hypothetical protein